jgi:cysteine desulfurase/selenocysteine lyase
MNTPLTHAPRSLGAAVAAFDPVQLRADFPILHQSVHGKPLVYLDNAATTQKPKAVLDALSRYYEENNANVHRGVHLLSQRATDAYEGARVKVQQFLNAPTPREIVFVRGTTEAINLVAQTYGRRNIQAGDEVLVTAMEHHSNLVPWQLICEEKGAQLRAVPFDDNGNLLLDRFDDLLNERTKIVAVTQLSNAIGTVNPVREIIRRAHARGVPVLVDGAQALPHMPVDVQALDCDFYAFSGHKIFGPTGIGVLYGKAALLEAMPPYQGGGGMIGSVTLEKTTYNVIPEKFEAGTPDIAGAVGLGAAIDYVRGIGMDALAAYEADLFAYAADRISRVPGLRMIGTARERAAVLSFVMDTVHPHDIGTVLDHQGVAIRTGHHCCQPLMARFGVPATARASLACYNTREDVDALVEGLDEVRKVFGA